MIPERGRIFCFSTLPPAHGTCPLVARHLLTDIDLLQNKGLDELDADTRRRLLNQYEKQQSNPFAADVAAWLRGEYVFDPACLTT
jgi:hypothetical protein